MTTLPVHIAAGAIAIAAGAVALSAKKGGRLHRSSGKVFVAAMVVMALSAIVLAILREQRFNMAQSLFAIYLVVTALLTVRDRPALPAWVHGLTMCAALAIGVADMALTAVAAARPRGTLDGVPAGLIFAFGALAFFAAAGDLRLLRARPSPTHYRLARHLWRMCFAMWIATTSFFLGQATKVLPPEWRIKPLLALPVLLVIGMMVYWLLRVRRRRISSTELKDA